MRGLQGNVGEKEIQVASAEDDRVELLRAQRNTCKIKTIFRALGKYIKEVRAADRRTRARLGRMYF